MTYSDNIHATGLKDLFKECRVLNRFLQNYWMNWNDTSNTLYCAIDELMNPNAAREGRNPIDVNGNLIQNKIKYTNAAPMQRKKDRFVYSEYSDASKKWIPLNNQNFKDKGEYYDPDKLTAQKKCNDGQLRVCGKGRQFRLSPPTARIEPFRGLPMDGHIGTNNKKHIKNHDMIVGNVGFLVDIQKTNAEKHIYKKNASTHSKHWLQSNESYTGKGHGFCTLEQLQDMLKSNEWQNGNKASNLRQHTEIKCAYNLDGIVGVVYMFKAYKFGQGNFKETNMETIEADSEGEKLARFYAWLFVAYLKLLGKTVPCIHAKRNNDPKLRELSDAKHALIDRVTTNHGTLPQCLPDGRAIYKCLESNPYPYDYRASKFRGYWWSKNFGNVIGRP